MLTQFFKDKVIFDNNSYINFKMPLFGHQVAYLKKFAFAPYAALLAEMGTGKTCMAINNFNILYGLGLVKKLLVVAPNGVHLNWTKNELPKYLTFNLPVYAFDNRTTKKEGHKQFKFLSDSVASGGILCVSWSSIATLKCESFIKKFLDNDFKNNMIVLDESDNAKNPTAKRTKIVFELSKKALYKRIMTGTPITNSPFDAWSQFNFLSDDILECKSYTAFKVRHGVFISEHSNLAMAIKNRTGARGVLIPQKDELGRPMYKNLGDLKQRIAPYSFRVLKKDCLDLPEKLYKNVYIELTASQQRAYDTLKNDGVMLLQNDEIPIVNKIAILTKLCQITGNNFIKDDGTCTKIDDINHKLLKCLEIVQTALKQEQQVIIWARYRNEIFDLINCFKDNDIACVSYFGDTDKNERMQAIDDFQNGIAKVFIANAQSGGSGITLTKANLVIYYSNSFSLRDRLQSEDRAHRIGQKNNVLYINLLAKNTVDEKIQSVLDSKNDVAKAITDFKNMLE